MANTANSTALTTDFNVTPYFDDYDTSKNFYRILFKPGYAVQGRELTQMQSMLQEQVNRFGKHLFKDGTIVLPGSFTLQTNEGNSYGEGVRYVKIKDLDTSNNSVDISLFAGAVERGKSDSNSRIDLVGMTYNVTAKVIHVLDGTQTSTNTKTLYVTYTSTSNVNNQIKVFQAGERIRANVENTIYDLVVADSNSTPTGTGSRFTVSEGVMFAKNHFIAFPTQSKIISRYQANPTARVGFYITEDIVDASMDSSLLDPAQEASNYGAPGADRLKLSPELEVVGLDQPDISQDFVTLLTIENGIVKSRFDRTQYNIIADELARRTFDESGNYVVQGLDIQVREHDDTSANGVVNFGRYANGNNQLLFIGVSSGTAYVQGYEIGTVSTTELQTEKGLAYSSTRDQISSATMGSYIPVDELVGSWELDKGGMVNLYDTPQNRISNTLFSGGTSPSGNIIGYANVASLEYSSGTEGFDANYNLYLMDVRMLGSNVFSNVRSFHYNSTTYADWYADVVLDYNGRATLNDVATTTLLYYVGSDYVKDVVDADNPSLSATSFSFNRTEEVASISTNGNFTITVSGLGEIFPYGSTTLTDSQKSEIILSLNQATTITPGGWSVSGTAGTKNVSGSGTFFTRLNVGDKFQVAGKSNTFIIASIVDNTNLTVTQNLPTSVTGNAFSKVYNVGDIIDLRGKGITGGLERTVTATPSSMFVSLRETFSTAINATISTRITRSGAREIQKQLRTNRYVKLNCATVGTTGALNLGIPDVYKIKSIRLNSGSYPSSNTSGTDVTTLFDFDNGQRDMYYDHAKITPRSIELTSSSRLLVELDLFEPNFTNRAGFFTIDSYPIEDNDGLFNPNTNIRTENIPLFKSPVTGREFNLRNMFDFRPLKSATADITATSPALASENPAPSSGFQNISTGYRFPAPSSPITYDYSYYFGRRDLVVVDKDKRFFVVKGLPGTSPITPEVPVGTMALASINITPYPSLSAAYASSINRKDLAVTVKKLATVRFTMRDIGVLKQRLVNLEYYTSLSVLEKAANDLLVKDATGLDRFKNGIFTDNFRDHSLGATYNNDYNITVDPEEKSIRPSYTMESFGYEMIANNSYLVKNSDLLTLKYTEHLLYEQVWATTDRNSERRDWSFVGNIKLFPDQDIWIDTTFLPDEQIDLGTWVNNNAKNPQAKVTTEWGAWKKYVVGYRVYTGQGANRQAYNYGNMYRTYDEARDVANSQNPAGNGIGVTIETVYNNVRTGSEKWFSDITQTAETGYKVVNVEVIPYIRPQTITISCTNFKPYTRVYCFFDNEPMANYCRPITSAQFNAIVDGVESTLPIGIFSAEGAALDTDANGTIYFQMRIPQEKKFRCGDRAVIVCDSFIPVNEASISPIGLSDDITTGGRAMFRATGTAVTKQRSILSTRHIDTFEKEVQESFGDSEYQGIPSPPAPQGKHCSAYSFLAQAPNGEEGMFLTSVDIFISRKSRNYGIWFEVREMNSGGQITRNAVPFSEVWYDNVNDIPISTNGINNPFKITFPAPLFLYHNTMYAFVIHPINGNPDTYLWISKLGQTDVNGKGQYVNRTETGTFFQTNNNTNWDIIPDVDLTCKFRYAKFNTNINGVATLSNKPVERIFLDSRSKSWSPIVGDIIVSGDRITVSGSNGAIEVGNTVVGVTSGQSANVVSISGSTYSLSNTGLTNGERIVISKGATVVSANVASITQSRGMLNYFFDGPTTNSAIDFSIAHLTNSDGTFKANDTIRSITNKSFYGNIDAINNFRYSAVSFEPSYLQFKNTSIAFQMRTHSNTGSVGSYTDIVPSETLYFTNERALFSRTNERGTLGGANTNVVDVTMNSLVEGVSPVLDLGRTHSIYLDNIIDANASGETASSGGTLINRYISKTITLAEGQDAEDIQVVLTSYRPPGTDVKVWLKVLNGDDATPFIDRDWVELYKMDEGDLIYSSQTDRNDFVEYKFGVPTTTVDRLTLATPLFNSNATNAGITSVNTGLTLVGPTIGFTATVDEIQGTIYIMSNTGYTTGESADIYLTGNLIGNVAISAIGQPAALIGTNGELVYRTDSGTRFSTYKYFAVKIGLVNDGTNNSAVYPRVGDLRCIALQM